jgi:hypothetical protein
MAAAIVSRGAILGWENALGLSATYFPAFIVATLYAGPAWGWGMLGCALLAGLIAPSSLPIGMSGSSAYRAP